MKITAVLLTLCILCCSDLKAQTAPLLPGTKWGASLNVPSPTNCLLVFTTDSAFLVGLMGKDSTVIETMVYRQKGDTLTLKKLSGGSPCGDDEGIYRMTTEGDRLRFKAVNDPCTERGDALSEIFSRVRP